MRTLFIMVTVAAVGFGYVAHEYRIVRAREAWRASAGSDIDWFFGADRKVFIRGDHSKAPGLVRCCLGDETYSDIVVYPGTPEATAGIELFPEADVHRWQLTPSQLRGEKE